MLAGDNNAPSARSDSPRQSQYSFRNIELQARESRHLPNIYSADIPSDQYTGATPGRGWAPQINNDAPTGLNPFVNNNINISSFDVDMTDNAGIVANNTTGLTPGSSATYRSSSSTYSPPQMEDEIQTNFNQPPASGFFPNVNGQSHGTQTYSNGKSPGVSVTAVQDDLFKVPTPWNAADGGTPSFQNFPPNADWDKMMQEAGMTWDPQQKSGMTPR